MKPFNERIGKIICFYLFFYSALMVFFAAMMALFYLTLDDRKPTWTLDSSLIGTLPGMGVKPALLVSYERGNPKSWKHYVEDLNEFLKPYLSEKSTNVQSCDDKGPDGDNICDFKLDKYFGPCSPEYKFGFESLEGGPCIFLKLNKIFGWIPEYYQNTTIPELMSENLKNYITESRTPNKIWVDCGGVFIADQENIGPINVFPGRGFDGKYFPFTNQEGYLSPLVAIHFENPQRGVWMYIECKAWARNIVHNRIEGRGLAQFALFIQ